MDKNKPVLIVGAGIAGLTAALSFARKGFSVDIIEQAAVLSEAGAGLQLSPNATRILGTLGVLPQLEEVWSEPHSIDLVVGTSLKTIASVPAGIFARQRWKAPYGVLRRADLQKILLAAVMAHPLCRLKLGVTIDGRPGETIDTSIGPEHGLVVGADGVWSKQRQTYQQPGKTIFSGSIAWRFTVREDDAADVFDSAKVMAFLGSGAHLVAYPMLSDRSFNVVAITSAPDIGQSLDPSQSPLDVKTRLVGAFGNWHPHLRRIFQTDAEPTIWPLHSVSDGAWHDGESKVLIGDAAHAMMPFAAQGAAMAIEDAFELAAFVAAGEPLSAFVDHRKPRIAKVRARGAFNRFAYHARGPIRLGRDIVLSLRRPEHLAADFDWLYGYEPRD